MRVDQLLPGFTTGDAISNYSLELQEILRSQGYQSEIFSVEKDTSMDARAFCRDYRNYTPDSPKDVLLYHFSVGSELNDFFKGLISKKILIYHNITPAGYFKGINREKEEILSRGREELRALNSAADLALGVSEYNRKELEGYGYKKTGVLPLILNEKILTGEINKTLYKKYDDNFVNIISVGRMTPNKKLEDVIKVFYYYKKSVNFNSRLFLIGSITGMSSYVEYLRGLAAQLGLSDVVFAGHVNSEDLRTYYKLADIFITMSEHEGFCIPLLEAMYFGIPVIAYNSSAIPEILGGSGVLVKEKRFPETAELISSVIGADDLRKNIVKTQNIRLHEYNIEDTKVKLMEYISRL